MATDTSNEESSLGVFGVFMDSESGALKESFLKNSAFYIFFPGFQYILS